MKKQALLKCFDVKTTPVSTDWTKSPTWEDTTVSTSMEMGLE